MGWNITYVHYYATLRFVKEYFSSLISDKRSVEPNIHDHQRLLNSFSNGYNPEGGLRKLRGRFSFT